MGLSGAESPALSNAHHYPHSQGHTQEGWAKALGLLSSGGDFYTNQTQRQMFHYLSLLLLFSLYISPSSLNVCFSLLATVNTVNLVKNIHSVYAASP